jgi:dephospho-CoA kinase
VSIVIGVCGFSGAGKSTFCREMARRFRLPLLSTGEVVRREVIVRGHPLTPESIVRVSDEIRRETGQRFVRILKPDLRAGFLSALAVLLDCLREEADLLALREMSYRVVLVAVAAAEEVRAARALARSRPGDPAGLAGLLALQETELRLGVDRLVARADHVVGNDGGLDLFLARSAAVVEEILGTLTP